MSTPETEPKLLPIPDLQGQVNFREWSEAVKIHLAWHGLEGVVDGTTSPPDEDALNAVVKHEAYRRKQA